jgi:GNAT superfamily N-acetyltransferase
MTDTVVMLRAIRWRDWRHLAQLSLDAFPDATPAQVSRTLRDAANIIVLEIAGKPAGYGAFRHERQGLLWCDWVTVDPQYRSQGYGARLVQAVESVAAMRGYKRVMLAVLKANFRAYQFHRANGYEVAGEDARKYHLMKEMSGPVERAPDIPAVRSPRGVRLWYRLLYGLLVDVPQYLR